MITSVVDGYNVTIFAYGQTGSGKTHTMSGGGGSVDDEEGVIPRAIRELFEVLEGKDEFYEYSVECYFVEVSGVAGTRVWPRGEKDELAPL